MVFVDRKAKYPGRWTMRKSDGSTEIVTLLRNDEPEVEGTPMNAETLNTLSDVAGADVARLQAEASAAQAQADRKRAENAADSAADDVTELIKSYTDSAANSAVSAKESETQSKFYSETAQKAANASVQGYSGGYSRTLDLTAPQSGWKTLSSQIGIYRYSADVSIPDCTAKWNAFAAILPESYMIGYRARVANIVETYDGGIRLYAANAPDGDVKFTLSVFAVGSSTYYLTVPLDGWTAVADPVGSKQWQCDVTLEDSSVQKIPMGMAALENTTEALSQPGLSATMETFDGYIRVYAKNKPTVPINIVVVLLARNEVN